MFCEKCYKANSQKHHYQTSHRQHNVLSVKNFIKHAIQLLHHISNASGAIEYRGHDICGQCKGFESNPNGHTLGAHTLLHDLPPC